MTFVLRKKERATWRERGEGGLRAWVRRLGYIGTLRRADGASSESRLRWRRV